MVLYINKGKAFAQQKLKILNFTVEIESFYFTVEIEIEIGEHSISRYLLRA